MEAHAYYTHSLDNRIIGCIQIRMYYYRKHRNLYMHRYVSSCLSYDELCTYLVQNFRGRYNVSARFYFYAMSIVTNGCILGSLHL